MYVHWYECVFWGQRSRSHYTSPAWSHSRTIQIHVFDLQSMVNPHGWVGGGSFAKVRFPIFGYHWCREGFCVPWKSSFGKWSWWKMAQKLSIEKPCGIKMLHWVIKLLRKLAAQTQYTIHLGPITKGSHLKGNKSCGWVDAWQCTLENSWSNESSIHKIKVHCPNRYLMNQVHLPPSTREKQTHTQSFSDFSINWLLHHIDVYFQNKPKIVAKTRHLVGQCRSSPSITFPNIEAMALHRLEVLLSHEETIQATQILLGETCGPTNDFDRGVHRSKRKCLWTWYGTMIRILTR